MLTGMRVGEIAALSWDSIDEKYICVTQAERRLDYSDRTSEIIIGKPKNGKIRRIPLTSEMKELFQKIRSLGHPDREGFVFTEEVMPRSAFGIAVRISQHEPFFL